MGRNDALVAELAKAFGLPVVGGGSQIWFFRTQTGRYYADFYVNRYIALGWDLIPASLIGDPKRSGDEKRAQIAAAYPGEKRPGLILGQLDAFYNRMQEGELVVIPSAGGKWAAVGVLGGVISQVERKDPESGYEQCGYRHKRSVRWLAELDLWTDVYLSKVLRAQQAVSNITAYGEMIYRNLHPFYLSADGMHITLQKKSDSEYRITDSIRLQSSVLEIHSTLADYYDQQDGSDRIVIKTAVGSPGFVEIILPYVPVSVLTAIFVYRGILGKIKSGDGETSTGILAVLTKGNQLLNDHYARKKTAAEIGQIEAQTRKISAEAEALEIANQKARDTAAHIAENTDSLRSVAAQNGFGFQKKLDEAG